MKKLAAFALITSTLLTSAHALILGADVGYLTDANEEYISARLGKVLKSDASLAHQVEIEIGYTGQKESGLKGDFVPVTANYRASSTAAKKLGYHFGAGVGFTRTKVSGYGTSDDGVSFTAQAFTGLDYKVTETASLHLGVKYLWIDDVKLFGLKVDVGDDVALTAGVSVRF